MGDRCYLSLEVHGPIASLRGLKAIAEAIAAEGFNEHSERDDVLDTLAEAYGEGTTASFEEYECNYANIDDVESAMQDYGCCWSVDHGAGGEYPGGRRSWSPERGHSDIDTDGNNAVLDVGKIRRALSQGDPLAAVHALVDEVDLANGADLPKKLEVGPMVARYLAKRIAERALNIKRAA